jgi:RHS repeat-associated protein
VQNSPNGPVSYSLGNGLSNVYSYDTLKRLNGGWVCSGSTSASCSGGTMVYGYTNGWNGNLLTGSSDSALGQSSSYGYDEFNRLTSRTVNAGTVQNFTYVYDRYGNRWQQNALQYGPSPQLSFNTANNEISTGGYAYDAAGNMTNDGFHTYTYDAEGNITAVDSGSTAQYVYNALNQRVRAVVGSTAAEYVFNAGGQRVSEWNGTSRAQLKGKYYLGAMPVAFYAGGAAHFEHQDWLGTERMRTTYNGGVEGSFTSLPFGDGQATTGTDGDANHYATLDQDTETDTDHAQFRQYSNVQGRWLSPDPYGGSYDFSNPQSINRYVYALNSPLASTDPTGLATKGPGDPGDPGGPLPDPRRPGGGTTYCDPSDAGDPYNPYDPGGGGGGGGDPEGPCFDPDPSDPLSFIPCYRINAVGGSQHMAMPNASNACHKSGSGGGPTHSTAPNNGTPTDPYKKRMFGTHWCGPGGEGPTVNSLDVACKAHDGCYDANGLTAGSNFNPLMGMAKTNALQQCNQALCSAAWKTSDAGNLRVITYFSQVPVGACHP